MVKKTSSHDLSSEIYNISLANKNTIGVDFLLHAKNPSMEGGQKGDTAQFGSSEAQHNSGQNIPTFASHTSETHNQAWGAPCRARQDLVFKNVKTLPAKIKNDYPNPKISM